MPKPCSKELTGIAWLMKQARIRHGWTQDRLAREIKRWTGTIISVSTIKQYEEGIREPSKNTILLVSTVFAHCQDPVCHNLSSEIQKKSAVIATLIKGFPTGESVEEPLGQNIEFCPDRTRIHSLKFGCHRTDLTNRCAIVRWNGEVPFNDIQSFANIIDKELALRERYCIIADMNKTGRPPLRALEYNYDWLCARPQIRVICFGVTPIVNSDIELMIKSSSERGRSAAPFIICANESSAQATVLRLQRLL